jgi:hypothetical protein
MVKDIPPCPSFFQLYFGIFLQKQKKAAACNMQQPFFSSGAAD